MRDIPVRDETELGLIVRCHWGTDQGWEFLGADWQVDVRKHGVALVDVATQTMRAHVWFGGEGEPADMDAVRSRIQEFVRNWKQTEKLSCRD